MWKFSQTQPETSRSMDMWVAPWAVCGGRFNMLSLESEGGDDRSSGGST